MNVIEARKLSTTVDGTFNKNTVNIIYGTVADWTKCMHFNEIYRVYVLFPRKVSDAVKDGFIDRLEQFEHFYTYAVIGNVDGALLLLQDDDDEVEWGRLEDYYDYELDKFYSQLELRNLYNMFGKKCVDICSCVGLKLVCVVITDLRDVKRVEKTHVVVPISEDKNEFILVGQDNVNDDDVKVWKTYNKGSHNLECNCNGKKGRK